MTDCLFCKMVAGEIPAETLYEDDLVLAIRDIQPRAPVHVLVIPKQHIPHVQHIKPEHGETLARMFQAANEVAKSEGVYDRGYRCAFNVLDDAGMTIHHLHLHVVGGRRLGPEG
ncbi:MAG: histidine triad nucleotide-binding protein [Dehalococcoidia bacterium]